MGSRKQSYYMQIVIQIAWQWNMVDNVFEECRDPFTIKTSIVYLLSTILNRFHYWWFVSLRPFYCFTRFCYNSLWCTTFSVKFHQDWIVRPYLTLHTFQWQSKFVDPVDLSYIVYIYYLLCSGPEYSWSTARWTLSHSMNERNAYILFHYKQVFPNSKEIHVVTSLNVWCLVICKKYRLILSKCTWMCGNDE